MKPRFREVAAPAALAAVVAAAGLAARARGDDAPPIHTIMEQVHTWNRAIGKGLRAPTALEAAGRKGIAADAASLIVLGKAARTLTEPAKERNKSQQDWIRKVDDFLRASDDFAKAIADPGSARPQVMQAYQNLQKTCTHCHSAFREEAH